MRDGIPRIASLQRSLAMLEAIVADAGQSSIAAIARRVDMPTATAHRQVATFEKDGYLRAAGKGRFLPGPKLMGLLGKVDDRQIIASVAEPILQAQAAELGCVLQLGTFDNDMVTYLVKAGGSAAELFTMVGAQLEAYCSAIGKVLLAHLPEGQCRAYLASESFVALTPATITDPAELAVELENVRQQGYATDREEVAEGLFCIAVPLFDPAGGVTAALSISQLASDQPWREPAELVPEMEAISRAVSHAVFGP